jgi:CheY-like chemotaxis protein
MKIKLIHWDKNQCEEKFRLLKSIGHHVDSESMQDKETFKRIKECAPDIFIIDLSRLPSHGKEIAVGLRQIKSTRDIPIIFTEGEKEKVDKIKVLLPDAVYSTWKNIRTALKKAYKQKDEKKIIPPSMMERYSNSALVKKLGIKENFKIALINSPKNFKETLGELPQNVKFFKSLKGGIDIIIWFTRSREEFYLGFFDVLLYVDKNKLWVATPKKSSGIATDINQNIVRNICLNSGLVDFKVCAIDETWSGLLFTKRK